MSKFQKGNPGKQKGTIPEVNKKAKELFISIMEGQVDHIEDALATLKKKDNARYLEVLSKFFPYFIPKKVEIDVPNEMVINVKRKD